MYNILFLIGKISSESPHEPLRSIAFSSDHLLEAREGVWSTEEEVVLQCRIGADIVVIGYIIINIYIHIVL